MSRLLRSLFMSMIILSTASRAVSLTPDAYEIEIASHITTNPGQQRASMTHNSILHLVARDKARDMATRPFWGHTDPDGYGPNYVVTMAGYTLPGFYSSAKDGNNIESIAAGNSTAWATFIQWSNSPGHRVHMLGEEAFWANQTYYAVGHYYEAGSPYGHYWAFLSAPPDPSAVLGVYMEWLFDNLIPLEIDDPNDDPDGDNIKTLMEYAFDYDPDTANTNDCFSWIYNSGLGRGEMTIPSVRPDLDPQVEVFMETTTSLTAQAWSSNGVVKAGDTFSAGDPADVARFFRLKVKRDPTLSAPTEAPSPADAPGTRDPRPLLLLF